MNNLAIITARGGSKRIPKKNIKEFCGKPILAYSIEAAIQSGLFNEVMVSTDSEEIAEVAKQYGAKVPFYRSAKTSDDYATTLDVLNEVLAMYKERGMEFDNYCCLYPTAPFITPQRLVDAFHKFEESHAASLSPVVRFSYPPQRGFVIENGLLKFMNPEYFRTRSQDLEPIYHDCGQFYFYSTNKDLSGAVPYIMPETEVQDIDNLEDWKIAEMKYRLMAGKK